MLARGAMVLAFGAVVAGLVLAKATFMLVMMALLVLLGAL